MLENHNTAYNEWYNMEVAAKHANETANYANFHTS